MRARGNALGRAQTRAEEANGNAGYPAGPFAHLPTAEGVTDSTHKLPNNKSTGARIIRGESGVSENTRVALVSPLSALGTPRRILF